MAGGGQLEMSSVMMHNDKFHLALNLSGTVMDFSSAGYSLKAHWAVFINTFWSLPAGDTDTSIHTNKTNGSSSCLMCPCHPHRVIHTYRTTQRLTCSVGLVKAFMFTAVKMFYQTHTQTHTQICSLAHFWTDICHL